MRKDVSLQWIPPEEIAKKCKPMEENEGFLFLKCCSNFGAVPIVVNKTIGCELKEAEKPEIAEPSS
jgi:hypothetical protein